jgi:hypothetical protein
VGLAYCSIRREIDVAGQCQPEHRRHYNGAQHLLDVL